MKALVLGALLAIGGIAVWFFFNPVAGFGVSRYGLTTYDRLPIPLIDFQVRPNGDFRRVPKTDDISVDTVAWLMESRPDVLIIATGWKGKAVARPQVRDLGGYELHILKTGDALPLYNRLRTEGRRVAVHLHSTG